MVLKDALKSHPMNSIRSCFIFLDGAAILEKFASHYKDLLVYVRDNVGKSISLKLRGTMKQRSAVMLIAYFLWRA